MSAKRVRVTSLSEAQRTRAAQSFATRRVPPEAMQTLLSGGLRPRSGDVVLARVARLGHHTRVEYANGRRGNLHLGDSIMAAYADRYATDQYESYVPRTLGRTSLVASGGIASQVKSRSAAVRAATEIVPLGLIGDERGRPLNLADFGLPRIDPVSVARPRSIAVFGTAMNAGKTTTIHHLLHGLARAGALPGATKITGTGSGHDYWVMLDAGAHRMLDFTDVGLASTFGQPIERLEDAAEQLVAHLARDGCGVIFVEIADGVYQRENQHLIRSPRIHALIDTVVFAASDAMGAVNGVDNLRRAGFNVAAVAGTLTRSPLAIRETQDVLGLPVLRLDELEDPRIIAPILEIDTSCLELPTEEEASWQIVVPGLVGEDGQIFDDHNDMEAPLVSATAVPSAAFPAHVVSMAGTDDKYSDALLGGA